ncbi:MAG: DUF6228 family protein [Gemmataceae bacterium]
MDTFKIPIGTEHGLTFLNRLPEDRAQPVEHFRVRIEDANLVAEADVYAEYASEHPARLFEEMARQWSGWAGELTFESLERELQLRCVHDKLGHITIHVVLRSGCYPEDWRVEASVKTEAGQLERLARDARAFFGVEG